MKNLEVVLILLLSFVNTGDKMGHENNWSSRLAHLMTWLTVSFVHLTKVNWGLLDDELKLAKDPVKRAELIAIIKEHFDIIDDKLEALIEDALDMASEIIGFISKAKSFISRVKDYFKK